MIKIVSLMLALVPITASAAHADDALYIALLKSQLAPLPGGVTAAHVSAAKVDADDRKVGALGNVQIAFDGSDAKARANYLVFGTAGQATTYRQRFDQLLTANHAARKFLPYATDADCADATKAQMLVCMAAEGRVIVYTQGALVRAGSDERSVAGPLIKVALDRLASIERSGAH
jgi:hypothetical protein